MSRIDVETDRLYRAALQEKSGKTREQCAAEAFALVCSTGGKLHAAKAELVLVAGVDTVRNGTVVDGEPCHLLSDCGPIQMSPEVLRHHLDAQDCFVKLVLHDGVHITHVKRRSGVQCGGRRTIEMKKSSIWRTTLANCSKSTGLVT